MGWKNCKPLSEISEQDRTLLWSGINRGTETECWLWTGNTNGAGYGQFVTGPDKRRYLVHRLVYFLTYGIDPGSLLCCHKCDTPLCCNPNHIFLGTQTENLHDCWLKGRRPHGDTHVWKKHPELVLRGEKHPGAKLTEAKVVEIRKLYASGKFTLTALATEFGVCFPNISMIVNRRTWRNVGG